MKLEMKKVFYTLAIVLFSVVGCTSSDINSEIPVSSDELIDQNVVYKSETVKVDVEEISSPSIDFAKTEKVENTDNTENAKETEVAVVETKSEVEVVKEEKTEKAEEMEVIVPPPAYDDATVDFTQLSYMNQTIDDDFENAVRDAQIRRGIKVAPVVKPLPKIKETSVATTSSKPFSKKLEIREVEPERNITFLSTIIYHSNTKADISARDLKALKNVAKFVREKDAVVRVVGNSSSRSKDMKEIQNKIANFDLSLLRAQKVADALVKEGVPREKIFINAVGDTEKIVEENMPINEAINRRTEIYINY